jgi:hypothetical protein
MLRRLPYATKLDMIDRALNVLAKSSTLEQAWRRSLDLRKDTAFKAYQIYSGTLNLIGRDRRDIVNQTLEYADYGAKDLLLTTDSYLRVPQLIDTVALLADLPGYRGKAAIIVADQKTETSFRARAGGARLFNLQRFWLDNTVDIQNHNVARQVLDTLRQTASTATEREMVEAITMNLHTQLIQALRTIAAR